MRVLWLCNVMLPVIGEYLNRPYSNAGGWLTGLSEDLLRSKSEELELAVCFPTSFDEQMIEGYIQREEWNRGLRYFGFPKHTKNEATYDERTETYLKEVLNEYKPEVVHVFGTEFAHTLAMMRVIENKKRVIIGMQGVLAVCAERYEANLPKHIVNRYTLRDILKQDNIKNAKRKFQKRAKFEEEALKQAIHVVGRTKFDFEETLKINPNRCYDTLNETLRDVFYEKRWDISRIESHSILVSQGDYPLKGLHFIFEALPEIIKKYPDVKLYVAGNPIFSQKTWKDRLKISSYGKYLESLIRVNHLENHVIFTGSLQAEKMCDRYLKSHVFVCPSVIENSPNSVGEAMLLGMPVISSKVGGVPDMITNGEEGLLVESANVDAFVNALEEIFKYDEMAVQMGKNANKKALQLYNREENFQTLLEIYHRIGNDANEE